MKSALAKPVHLTHADHDLIQAYLEGSATAEQLERFERYLIDPAFQVEVARYAVDLSNLDELGRQNAIRTPMAMPWVSRQRRGRMLAAAAIVLMALTIGWLVQDDTSSALVTVAQTTGRVVVSRADGRASYADAGSTIAGGREIRTLDAQSTVDVHYDDGTQLSVGGDSVVVLEAGPQKRIVLGEGRMTAEVTPQQLDQAMSIDTPHARLTILGTRLTVSTDDTQTRLTVHKGRVRFTRLSDGQSIEIAAGREATAGRAVGAWADEPVAAPAVFDWTFDQNLPEDWSRGVHLALESGGAVRAVPVPGAPLGVHHQVVSPSRWHAGLFPITAKTHLNLRYRFDKPGFMHVILCTRTTGPDKPRTMNLIGHGDGVLWRGVKPGVWHTASLPLSAFTIHAEPPILRQPEDLLAYLMIVDTQNRDRGLVVDRIWVTEGPVPTGITEP